MCTCTGIQILYRTSILVLEENHSFGSQTYFDRYGILLWFIFTAKFTAILILSWIFCFDQNVFYSVQNVIITRSNVRFYSGQNVIRTWSNIQFWFLYFGQMQAYFLSFFSYIILTYVELFSYDAHSIHSALLTCANACIILNYPISPKGSLICKKSTY